MEDIFDHIDADRLCDAADAVLQAVHEVAARGNGSSPSPVSLLGSDEQPECLSSFDRHEVEAATLMLVRLGLLRGARAV